MARFESVSTIFMLFFRAFPFHGNRPISEIKHFTGFHVKHIADGEYNVKEKRRSLPFQFSHMGAADVYHFCKLVL